MTAICLKYMQTWHALCTSSEQLSAQVQACILQAQFGTFSSPLFQILSHSDSDSIFRSPLNILFMIAPQENSTILAPPEGKKVVISMHKVIGRSDLLLMFLQQPYSSKGLTRISPIVIKPVKQCQFTSAEDLTTCLQHRGCTLKNNPNKQQIVCLSPVSFFRQFVNLFHWLPNTDHLLC